MKQRATRWRLRNIAVSRVKLNDFAFEWLPEVDDFRLSTEVRPSVSDTGGTHKWKLYPIHFKKIDGNLKERSRIKSGKQGMGFYF